jgi:dihydrodipicolinate synthase/N-acetylneuraminate lyase
MRMETPTLLEALNSVTAIPIIPFSRPHQVDYRAHAKNIDYLMRNNYLSEGRPRVIALAGTSLIHHVSDKEQIRLMDATGRQMGDKGVLMSGIVPNPITTAGELIEAQAKLERPPDVYLMMPLTGICSPEGIYEEYMRLGEQYGKAYNVRFLYYFRQSKELETVVRLIQDSPYFIGVKVGTGEEDVRPLVEGVGNSGMVIWGIGDRSTGPAELGTRGHTSGIAVAFARASDEINNAQRQGDYETSRRIENEIAALEEIRFRQGRVYNYSAVVEAMILSGFEDIDGGQGGPFNPRVPTPVAREVQRAIEPIREYH